MSLFETSFHWHWAQDKGSRKVAKAKTAKKQKSSKKARKSSVKQGGAARKKAAAKKSAARKRPTTKKKSGGKAKVSKTPAKKAPKKARKAAPKPKAAKKKAAAVSGKKAAKAKVAKKNGAAGAKPAPGKNAQVEVTAKPAKKAKAAASTALPVEALPSIEEALATLPYGEGQFVVHPKYGLGKVDRITDRQLSTRTVPCMEISFPYQEMKLTIPVDQVARSGLRLPIGRRDIDNVFKVLRGRATFDAKRRSAKRVIDYRKRLSVGDPTSLAEAVRDLARLSLKKSLSYEERTILGTALRILSREVALVCRLSRGWGKPGTFAPARGGPPPCAGLSSPSPLLCHHR